MAEAPPNGTADGAGRELSALLRTWWEDSARTGRRKPTQASLARQVGVTQTTLSRYLNPAHPLAAPPDAVRTLHAVLGAPPDGLEAALLLARSARAVQRPAGDPDPRPGGLTGPRPDRHAAAEPGPRTAPPRRGTVRRALLVAAVTGAVLIAGWTASRAALEPGTGHGVRPAAAPPRPEAPRWPLVRKGETSSLTWTVQRLLKAHGHTLRADGVFGPETHAQVVAFQERNGLQPDGKVGRHTWRMLVLPAAPGDRGPQVEAVQDLLHRAGHPADITGAYTAATRQMVRDFQRRHGLPATGAVDEETWRSLTTAPPA
ncbi:peptidoglycan-binding protein [Streptomyces sp. TRM76323]|uniref:Peptidoglycan-binding protein n=1 Tax=Streptomyces tamarix TaxID=3078565 RepID=A0ABU3QV50_9ACTN|nr:peptidoglycan-binding protein [Streptomyces tamarix]MDT9686650.1 peptidoglycan-binding protein [Streptomyces tamarix]